MIRKQLSLYIALVALALTAESEHALAADRPSQEKVTVQGPYTVREQIAQGHTTQVDQVSITKSVSYTDLNLSNPADVALLKDRISRAARDSCNKLRRSYSAFSFNTRQDCIANAVRPNFARVDQIAMLGR